MPTTTGRSRGRRGVRSGTPGAVGEHMSKIMVTLIAGTGVIAFTLVMTKPGRDIDAATQHFMLFYAGVFALIGLTASVGVGLLATDRIVMTPGHRVMAQAVHRAVSFGALAFLVIHIVTEILAQRAHVIDALIPFLSPYRTFYIGLGTIASDLILLIVVTSIFRKRFGGNGKVWRWRAIHYSAYLAFVFGVLHGLLGGRTAKPYVDWSYGFAIALTALALVVRFLAISLRSKDKVGVAPGAAGGPAHSQASPLHYAALSMAQAQLGGTIQMLPGAGSPRAPGLGTPGGQPWGALPPAPGRSSPGWSSPSGSGPLPALSAAPGYEAYQDPALTPLGAPVYGAALRAGTDGYPYPAVPGRQPLHEPEYDGPPRFEGAPRKHVSQDDLSSYPYPAQGHQPGRGAGTGPLPRVNTGPMPRLGTGPMPRADSGPMPRAGTGPMPRAGSAPRRGADVDPAVGTGPATQSGPGQDPRRAAGPRPGAGPVPGPDSHPGPRTGSAPAPATATRHSRRTHAPDPRYHDTPRRNGGDAWR